MMGKLWVSAEEYQGEAPQEPLPAYMEMYQGAGSGSGCYICPPIPWPLGGVWPPPGMFLGPAAPGVAPRRPSSEDPDELCPETAAGCPSCSHQRPFVNGFNGNCFGCHNKAKPKWDLVCEQDHGCDKLPFSAEVIDALQNADARCKK